MKDPDLNPLKFLRVRFTKLNHHVLDFRDFGIESGRSRRNGKRFAPTNLGARPTGFAENRSRQFRITSSGVVVGR